MSTYPRAYLFIFMVAFGIGFIEGILALFPQIYESILALIWQLAVTVPSIAIVARRLHDINMSGWWYLLIFTIIGIIPLIIWFCTEGTKEANKFGDPIDLSI